MIQTNLLVIYKAFCLYVAQGRLNEVPSENRIHSEGLLVYLANHYITWDALSHVF